MSVVPELNLSTAHEVPQHTVFGEQGVCALQHGLENQRTMSASPAVATGRGSVIGKLATRSTSIFISSSDVWLHCTSMCDLASNHDAIITMRRCHNMQHML